jgi:DNA-binding response OmpR family regulator
MSKILVADGNIDAADALAAALRLQGHAVRTGYIGKQCLQLAHEFRPNVVLLRKKSIDAQTTRQLRAEAPVITIGPDGDLQEPIDMLALIQLIRQTLN